MAKVELGLARWRCTVVNCGGPVACLVAVALVGASGLVAAEEGEKETAAAQVEVWVVVCTRAYATASSHASMCPLMRSRKQAESSQRTGQTQRIVRQHRNDG